MQPQPTDTVYLAISIKKNPLVQFLVMKTLYFPFMLGFAVAVGLASSCRKDVPLIVPEQEKLAQVKKTSGIVTTIAGTGEPGVVDGDAHQAKFYYPLGIATNSRGNLYITEDLNLRRLTPLGTVSTLLGCGFECYLQEFQALRVAVDEEGTVYYTDSYSLYKLTATQIWTRIAGNGRNGSEDGRGEQASFYAPRGLAIDKNGNVIVADAANCIIRQVTPEGVVSTIAGIRGVPGFADGRAHLSKFNYPAGVAINSAGNIYVADAENNRIRKISSDHKTVSTLAGDGREGWKDGKGSAAEFNAPNGMTIDRDGNLYVTESSRIRRVSPTGIVTTIAGTGEPGFADGVASQAKFNYPSGITIDAEGNLFIADTRNNRIRKLSFK